MKIMKCECGYFFDSDKFEKCPHCGSVAKKVDKEKQKIEKLSADKINLSDNNFKLKLSYGYFPIHNVEYQNGTIKFYNRINPRDGGVNYPEHFFDEFELALNSKQRDSLNKIIKSLEFVKASSFEKTIDISVGAPSKLYNKLIADDGKTYLIENEKSLIEFFNGICNFPKFENIVNKKHTLEVDAGDKNQTLEIYPDKIRVFIKSQNEDVFVEKNSFFVGRSHDCDIQFDKSMVSRIHAIFYYDDGTWYIEDLNSKNGCWLNDIKLEPMKMYRLKSNDIIDLAHTEKLIFFKHNEEIMLP